ncbi:MAG: S-adenosyl-l-methionine hydroxide adenosyltransferase family protein [Candidatus Bathyarchaeota archaeon]|nr:S-adenosyl-l-methionine hydroxide adenosyltransferase family protein [Candidatus Bathyarchaeota archaeon]
MPKRPIITLLSDFGLRDSYVAEMKAVILSIAPNAHMVDISHEVRKFDVRMGAFLLARAAQFFPRGTVHLAVVDPGVGTERRPIIVETKRSFYVGPDNGLLILSAQKENIEHVYVIENRKYMLTHISRTFHGRDIFAPAAAYLARGVPPSNLGSEIFDPVIPQFAKPEVSGSSIRGEIIHVDDFGNLVTNIADSDLRRLGIEEGDSLLVELKGEKMLLRLCKAYGEVQVGMPLAIIGSCNFIELSVNRGDASKFFGVKDGEEIVVYKQTVGK